MAAQQSEPKPLLIRMAQSVRIVPLVLAVIGSGVLAYGVFSGGQNPQTFGAALIGIALVSQISAAMRGGRR